jgi:SAM-dependent methyltransferase
VQRVGRWFDFNRWYLRRSRPPWDTGISPPELHAYIGSHAPGCALDLGCGTGTNVITLAQHDWRVTGVDFAIKAIAEAKRKARAARVCAQVDLHVGDVTRLAGVDGPFDLALDIGCYHGLTGAGMDAYAREVKRVLAPRGALLLYVLLKDDAEPRRTGVVEGDLQRFKPELRLVERMDGTDTGNGRRSAWLNYQRA